jgi:heme-degrading monooxygenase HmoA
MIARIWTARARRLNVPAYRQHFETDVLARIRRLDGYRGASLLTLDVDDETEIVVISRWVSREAIRAFAGADIERAVVADTAQHMLLSWDERVRHFTVRVDDSFGGRST